MSGSRSTPARASLAAAAQNAGETDVSGVDLSQFDAVLLDLDGTVYHDAQPLPGAVELINRLTETGRVFACIFDDLQGLKCRHDIGLGQILFETDYPHSDGTFPHSRKVAHSLFAAAGALLLVLSMES